MLITYPDGEYCKAVRCPSHGLAKELRKCETCDIPKLQKYLEDNGYQILKITDEFAEDELCDFCGEKKATITFVTGSYCDMCWTAYLAKVGETNMGWKHD